MSLTAGCTDSQACNYDAGATDDDGSCLFFAEAGYDCDGNCLVDSDGDAICDQDEVTGCQDSTACNYDANATDAGYCVYADAGYDCDGNCVSDTDGDGCAMSLRRQAARIHRRVITMPGPPTMTAHALLPRRVMTDGKHHALSTATATRSAIRTK